ncbi:MAG TPA: glutamate--cysteine ligase [Micromonosporaceae bacterium]|nr:glutamate--cysteine ligase [Micromonosporaceae bacterium]
MSTTMGVEEEFLLIDPATGAPVDAACRVLARADHPNAPEALLQPELLQSQVESATGICRTLAEVRAQVGAGRRALAAAAGAEGLWLVSTGTPVCPGAAPSASPGARFAEIMRTYAGVVAEYQCCGCHVHVGVPDRELAVAVLNHLAPWLPTLLALSANSPFECGRDTGYASWRIVTQSRFPGFGTAPWFGSAADYDRQVDALVDCGVLADAHQSFWLARLSSRFPTVELRVADAAATVTEAVLQAALSRALVHTALAALATGREARPVNAQLAAAAVWTAARYGLRGPGVHLGTGRQAPATDLLAELVAWVEPALTESGDLTTVRAALATLTAEGTGADRQRRAAGAGPLGVLRMLSEQTRETV